MKLHIPDASGRTYCGRDVRQPPTSDGSPADWSPSCIDIRRQAIDDATCTLCHRVDNARQAALYRDEMMALRFAAVLRWADNREDAALSFNVRRQSVCLTWPFRDGEVRAWRTTVRPLEDFEP